MVVRAMERFWTHGFYATSINDLVETTGVSRHGLYAEYSDKRGLFVAAMEVYFEEIVTPAFKKVEAAGAGFADIRAFFDFQINLAISKGLPGSGCLVANTMVESGPHDDLFRDLVLRHLNRLTAGFRSALENQRRTAPHSADIDVDALAAFLTISAQGLWAVSRMTREAEPLKIYVNQLLTPIEERFQT